MGLTFSDQRHPGSRVNRPAVTSSMLTMLTLPLSKVLVSSAASTFFAFKVSESAMAPYAPRCSLNDCRMLLYGDGRIPQMSYIWNFLGNRVRGSAPSAAMIRPAGTSDLLCRPGHEESLLFSPWGPEGCCTLVH